MADYDVSIRCGDVLVHSGELVFADFDGIVVAPREAEKRYFALLMKSRSGEQYEEGIAGGENITRGVPKIRCAMIHKKPWTNQGFLVD